MLTLVLFASLPLRHGDDVRVHTRIHLLSLPHRACHAPRARRWTISCTTRVRPDRGFRPPSAPRALALTCRSPSHPAALLAECTSCCADDSVAAEKAVAAELVLPARGMHWFPQVQRFQASGKVSFGSRLKTVTVQSYAPPQLVLKRGDGSVLDSLAIGAWDADAIAAFLGDALAPEED